MSVAKSTAKLKRITPGEVGAYMDANELSSIVAVDAVDGWPYRIKVYKGEGTLYIGAELIVCNYDDASKKYTLVDGSDNDSVTKVQNLPCSTVLVSQSVVKSSMSNFLEGLKTDHYEIDEVTAKLRTDNVGDGSGLTYNDLDVSLLLIDEE